MGLREIESALPPGFRFFPSDEELVCYYLRKKVANERITSGTMVEVDLHAREPWELPEVAKLTAEEWYFFSFRDRKYATGSRTNRATKTGYWKATGKDRMVHESTTHAMVGMRKTLVFYRGRAPNGQKTAWVMHEFRLETTNSPPKEDWVLCRVFHKRKAEAEQPNHMHQHNSNGPSSTTTHPGSSPDPSVVDKFDHQTGTALLHGDISSNCHSSNALLNLAMLRYNFLDRFPHDECDLPIPSSYVHLWAKTLCADHGDSCAIEKQERQTGTPHDMVGMVGASTNNNSSNTMELEIGYGEDIVGFEEHGMGEIEMESEDSNLYKDGLYF